MDHVCVRGFKEDIRLMRVHFIPGAVAVTEEKKYAALMPPGMKILFLT